MQYLPAEAEILFCIALFPQSRVYVLIFSRSIFKMGARFQERYRTNPNVLTLFLSYGSMQTEIISGIEEVIRTLLSPAPHQDLQWCIMRLEVVAENALGEEAIPLEAVDLINQAISAIKNNNQTERNYEPYSASQIHNERRPGRPKFQISEDQLSFFKGI